MMAEVERSKVKEKRQVLLPIACVVLLVVNGLLLYTVQRYKAQADSYLRMLGIQAGTQVTDLRGVDASGKAATVVVTGQRRTVLLVFSPTCGYCEKNWPKWHALLGRIGRGANVALVNLGADLPDSYLAQHQATGHQLLTRLEPSSRNEYRFNLTPQTILVGAGGVIEKVWTGALEEAAIREIQAALQTSASAGR